MARVVKNLPGDAGDASSIPEMGRSPEEGNGNSLQYSCLGIPMYRGIWWATVLGVANSGTRLSVPKLTLRRKVRNASGVGNRTGISGRKKRKAFSLGALESNVLDSDIKFRVTDFSGGLETVTSSFFSPPLAMPHSLQDLSSPTREWTCVHGSRVLTTAHHGTPANATFLFFKVFVLFSDPHHIPYLGQCLYSIVHWST